jgi:hypothetical protein
MKRDSRKAEKEDLSTSPFHQLQPAQYRERQVPLEEGERIKSRPWA